MMDIMRILKLALCLLLVFSSTATAASPERPEMLPALLQEAIDAKNGDAALPHLNLESILDGVLSDALPQISQAAAQGRIALNPPLAAALGSLQSGNEVTRLTVILFLDSELEKFILYGINSGSFSGDPVPQDQRMAMNGGVFSKLGDISLDRKEFSGARLLAANSGSATVETALYDYGTGMSYPLRLKLELRDDIWTIVRVDNAAELCDKMLPPKKEKK